MKAELGDILCNMAAARCLVVCEPLCFVFNRYGKATSLQLIEILSSFYDTDKLNSAKKQLCDDIDVMKIDKWPRPSRRRDSGNRAKIEADDIVSLFSFLDEKQIMDKLPIYVCANVDNIPTTRWFDGDLQFIMSKLNNLELEAAESKDHQRKMETCIMKQNGEFLLQLNTALDKQKSEISSYIEVHNTKLSDVEKTFASIDHDLRDAIFANSSCTPAVNSGALSLQPGLQSVSLTEDARCDRSEAINNRTSARQQPSVWSGLPYASTVLSRDPRQQRLSVHHPRSTADSVTADSDNESGRVFKEVLSRRAKRRKTTSGSALDMQPASANKQSKLSKPRNLIKVVGELRTAENCKIKASGNILKKLVYCVSNVSDEFNCDDLKCFLSDNDIQIVSCFDSKTKFTGTKAFRVCISSKYEEKFLSSNIWPEDVIVREWFFKGNPTQNNG